ncbi:3'-5' exonuclease [Paenalcaligenes hominis]|uniref:3'-5' exonuclease n=1 Tax=Paenalcaligenes hominis TaxID=643674 RepID=UPI0035241B67
MASAPRFIPRSMIPTSEQVAIQCSQHRITLIEANAGAAKTTTLALRIGEALARGLAPEQILALVFTDEAKEVLHERLKALGVAPFIVNKLALYTVEDFAHHVLHFWEEENPPRLSSLHELKPMALEALDHLSQHPTAQYGDELEFRTHHVALSQFFQSQLRLKASLAVFLNEEESAAEKALQFGVTLSDFLWTQHYEILRQSPYEGVLFRGPQDATYDLASTLLEQPDLLELLPEYRLIVVDELHDANEAAFQILRLLAQRPQTYVVAAGDKDQVIQKHLAADATYLHARFEAYFEQLVRLPLTYTYRHGPYLAYATAQFKQKKVDSLLPLATQIHVHRYAQDQAVVPVVQALLQWQRQGGRLAQCAVLFRDVHQSIHLENQLLTHGVPYTLHGMQSYLQRDEILFLRAWLALALRDLAAIQQSSLRERMVRALALFSELSFTELDIAAAAAEIAETPALLRFFYEGQMMRRASEHDQWRFKETLGYLEQVSADTSAAEVLAHLMQTLDVANVAKRIYVFDHAAEVIQKSMSAFLAMAQQLNLGVAPFYQWCAQHDPSTHAVPHAVTLSCVAQAKGKEYEHVLLPYLEMGEFPSLQQDAEMERNLFYVGITRAQKRLSLFVPQTDHQVSEYVHELRLEQLHVPTQQRLHDLQQSAVGRQLSTTSSQIAAQRINLRVPFAEKDQAKELGARWDPVQRVWFVPPGVNPAPFTRWVRSSS